MTAQRDIEERLAKLPRVPLAVLPTPLEAAPRLSRELGVEILVKRDDLTGLAMGGNKARKLEFIVADAQAEGADMLITSAAAQSNFCRMTAGAARKLGMRAGLLLRGSGREPLQGNLLLDHLLGAEIRFTSSLDPYATETRELQLAWLEEERRAGQHPYLVYIHGGSRPGALSTLGYVAAALELAAQLSERGKRADHVYLAVGSGGTAAGLALGLRWLGHATRVVGVCVSELSPVVGPKLVEFAQAGADLIDLPRPDLEPMVLDDSQRGAAYGEPTSAGMDAIRRLAHAEALFANPVYTGKALASLFADIEAGVVRSGDTVVYMHTGGDPLVYAYAEALAAGAPA